MNSEIVGFNYNGSIVPFELGKDDVMINATAIVKIFPNKRINDFLSNKQTKDLIKQVKDEMSVAGISVTDLVVTVQGGIPQNQGTWMHRKIAIAFAMWCSPALYSWCLEKLDEIISNGYALRDNQIANLQAMITANQPKVDYYDNYLTLAGSTTYSMRDIVKLGGFKVSNIEVYNRLEAAGYIIRNQQKGITYLKEPWSRLGYVKYCSVKMKNRTTGVEYFKERLMWTECGRHWICSLSTELDLL